MGLKFNVSDSEFLREPIDRARRKSFEAGERRGVSKGYASAITTLLRLKFPDDVPERLTQPLAALQPEVLSAMIVRTRDARSVEDVLGSHMPASGYAYGH